MDHLTTYRAKGKEVGLIFLFKYDLNGNLKQFEISEGELNEKQKKWLFSHFPADEKVFKDVWINSDYFKQKFEINVSPANISFEALWILYDYKVSKKDAETAYKKAKQETIIKCFISIPAYKKHLSKTQTAQAHLSRFINGEYYNNEYK
ncbi:MAG: hypothetical protein REI96_06205 [Flavobacterium nitrogenifigens]|uniref:hypothetical protein n=1 Tax=Flavobacterium nitrogenifigens TaxID=1617283 RepID=UPI002807E0E6|nr:hypothetical protein [Flavobacterium nitrogenifigens]MDQ8012019.1 hypothetical protein [Flavobacterium nitrogenifigens]